jgi:hypothetical protein
MIEAAHLAETQPERFAELPERTPVQRVDEVKAARDLNLRWSR